MDMARQDAKLTHPHEVCQDANAVFVATLGFAIRSGASKSEVYDYAIELAVSGSFEQSVVDRLRAAGEHPRQDFTSQMGWVLIAFQNAFFRLLHAESIEDGVVDTVRAGGDTDTNAAIVGALLGAVHGRDRIPKQWVDRLLACRPIGGLEDIKHPRPAEYWPVDALVLAENLLVAGERKSKRPRAQEGMA
jgi:ADP-ribosylglycohydrolase